MEILKQSSATREDLGLLAVMEAIEDKDKTSQREIARETGLNLKKVNYALHKLLERGYVKFQKVRDNPDKRAYLYILTPPGIKAKSQLTYRFLKFTLDFYNKVEEKLRRCLNEMHEEGVQRLLLYGASDAARIVYDMAGANEISIVGVVDDQSPTVEFMGRQIIQSERIDHNSFDAVLITSLDSFDSAEQSLLDAGVRAAAIWELA